MNSKKYNIKEANNLIPWIDSSFKAIKKHQEKLKLITDKYIKLKDKVLGNGFVNHDKDFSSLESAIKTEQTKIDEILKKISVLGIIIRDINLGIIDFPSISNEKPIFLCWKIGESYIKYWHLQDEGFNQRKLL